MIRVAERGYSICDRENTKPSGFSKWDYHLNPFERDKVNSMSLAMLRSSLRKGKKKKKPAKLRV